MISSWAFVFLLFIGASFFAKLGGEVSRFWLSAFFCVGLAALIADRILLRAMVRGWARGGRLDRRTIIVGSDHSGEKLVEALNAQEIPTYTSSASSTIATMLVRWKRAPAVPSLGRSTILSNSPAVLASTSCCSRFPSRRRRGFSKC